MFHAFGLLLASALVPTMLVYSVGMLFIRRLRLTNLTQVAGLLIALIFTAILALIMAPEPTTQSASGQVMLASIAGSLAAIIIVALAGKRKPQQPEV